MKLPRRQFLHLAAGAAALPTVPRFAWVQAYPTRPVRIIVGFAPGGPADLIARLIGQWLSERLGQQFIIENRPGAGSNIATEAVVRAPPDGYTLLLVTSTNAINTTLYEKLNFDFVRDIVPVTSVNRSPGVMEVNPLVPAKSVPEFIAYAKANPGKISMASAGPGSAPHVYGELFKAMTGADLVTGPLSRLGACISRSLQRASAGHVRHPLLVDRAHQGGQAARAGGNHCGAFDSATRLADGRRIRAGLRGKRMGRHRRAKEHPLRDH
jgi:tripartite-type tricarboxylate transporter receptor subunit TctC